ncbi:MAG: hypothetical protein M1836_004880 [Candelina mexicana]|nr:MAG: hypothetical protein M1836_004880 [Candelina mexicana]
MADVPTIGSRVRGSILGVAVVDALGGPAEFKTRGSFPKVESFIPNEHFGLPPGTWTDDTSMTLCLAQSLIDTKGTYIPQNPIRKYRDWFRNGYLSATGYCFDIGGATRSALTIWDRYFTQTRPEIDLSDPEAHTPGQELINQKLNREVEKPTHDPEVEICCGNGSLMRVAPIGLVYNSSPSLLTKYAALSSEATHPYPTNAEACIAYTRLIALALRNAPKEALVSDFAGASQSYTSLKSRFHEYTTLQSWQDKGESDISSSGYVINTLEAALWAFFTTEGFRDGAVKVVNLGDDADTVGAVYGGLAGAFYGHEAIPEEWIQGLQKKEVVERIADGLAELVEKQKCC